MAREHKDGIGATGYGGQEHRGKRGQIFRLLSTGNEVSALELSSLSLQYQARLHELRSCGLDVRLTREVRKNGVRFCYYKLFPPRPQTTPSSTPNPEPDKLFAEVVTSDFALREMGVKL